MSEKKQLKVAFRMEMIGTGLYRSLAAQYGDRYPDLQAHFLKFSRDEHKHGKLFARLFLKTYGRRMHGETFWIVFGRGMGLAMRPLSLRKKMKKLSMIEAGAVERITQDLPVCENPGLARIMASILPDEKAHAGLYRQWFPI